jgi:hypothetical protein
VQALRTYRFTGHCALMGKKDILWQDFAYVLALFAALTNLAVTRGWPTIRWITQHFNKRGRAFYDRYTGGPSYFIVYQWNLD